VAWAERPIWTDLAWSQLDEMLPPARRRVVVSVQKAVEDADGRFSGVARAALLASAVDAVSELRLGERDPHRIFISDADGRLITRLSPEDRLELVGEDLRISQRGCRRLSRSRCRARSSTKSREWNGQASSPSAASAGWPPSARWRARRIGSWAWWSPRRLTRASCARCARGCWRRGAVIIALVLLGGGASVIALRRGLGRIRDGTMRMSMLEFEPASTVTPFRDVQEVLSGLEQAKTALRAWASTPPLDLVRELYAENREPALGGELRELSILFTDLEGFTSLSERLSPDELARALGLYLDAMTGAIRSCGGTIGQVHRRLGDGALERAGVARASCATRVHRHPGLQVGQRAALWLGCLVRAAPAADAFRRPLRHGHGGSFRRS